MKFYYYLPLFLLVMPFVSSLEVTTYIDPLNATTTTTLHCVVNANGTGVLSANITWFINGVNHPSDNETLSLIANVNSTTSNVGDVEPSDTAKSQGWICQATVSNQTAVVSSNSTQLTIANSPPVLTYPSTTQTATEDTQFGPIVATATDADGDAIVGWISTDLNASDYGGNHLFSITSAGQIQFTPENTEVGNHTIAILASDGELLGGKNIIFQVLEVNDSPILGPIIDQQVTEGEALNYYVYASDEENDPFDWTITSALPALTITKINSSHALINITPTSNDDGNYTVNVTVYTIGNSSMNDSASFTLTINVTNKIPNIFFTNNPQAYQGSSYAVNFTANDTDVNDTLNFSITANCSLPNIFTILTTDNTSANATGEITVANLTNDHVVCRQVTVSVTDTKNGRIRDTNSTTVTLNITNTNDAPVVYQYSYYANSYSQYDIKNLSAPTNLPYTYYVNATDPDEKTYEGEVITYTDNTTLFDINATTGKIEFTPNTNDTGNYLVLINVSDDQGLYDTIVMNITVITNNPPVMTAPTNISCLEDISCSFLVNATDPDAGNILSFSTVLLTQNTISGLTPSAQFTEVNKTASNSTFVQTYTNDGVGNYTYNITVSDEWGAIVSQVLAVIVNNTNDDPYFDMDQDKTPDNISLPQPIVEGYQITYLINTSDDDLINNNDTLTLITTITGPNTSLFTPTKTSAYQWQINFTPGFSDDGSYTINFTLKDAYNKSATQIINFTIFNQSSPPVIEQIRPYFNTTLNNTVDEWINTSLLTNNKTSINTSEGKTVVFRINYTDNDTQYTNITIKWYVNSSIVQQGNGLNTTYTKEFGYFDAGNYTYTVVVQDAFYEAANFTWQVEVYNTNRAPILKENLKSYDINQTTTISNYLLALIDPDDDLNSNNVIDSNENNSLIYSSTTSTKLNISISGADVTLVPVENGNDTVYYTAIDDFGLAITSNAVNYNITVPPDETIGSSSSSSSSSSSGGGSGGSSTSYVPYPYKSDPEPYSIDIITPEPIITYNNDTVIVPLKIHNPSSQVLTDIRFNASFKNKTINNTLSFDNDYISSLEEDESTNITLSVKGYLDRGVYEIVVEAQVADPEFEDTALVLINSLERSTGGDEVQTKIRFAKDLLSANPECIELNEFILQAQRAVDTRQLDEAQRLLTVVIDGCRYLVSQSSAEVNEPSGINISWFTDGRYAKQVLYGMIILLISIASMLLMHYYNSAKQED